MTYNRCVSETGWRRDFHVKGLLWDSRRVIGQKLPTKVAFHLYGASCFLRGRIKTARVEDWIRRLFARLIGDQMHRTKVDGTGRLSGL